jgi:pyruvate dehydrogenase E2 component (dihydrolipoamide acetyltransferase)
MAALEVRVPDIGDFHDIPVIEVLVKSGDTIAKDAPLVTLESDKATMEVPSPAAGIVQALAVKVGDKVSEGTPLLTLDAAEVGAADATKPNGSGAAAKTDVAAEQGEAVAKVPAPPGVVEEAPPPRPAANLNGPESHPIARPDRIDEAGFRKAHASPTVRKYARELGVDLARVPGSGPKERILVEDVQAFVKDALGGTANAGDGAGGATSGQPLAMGAGLALLPWPAVDFAKFGPIEAKPLSRIRKISGANLHRNWVMIPHVTQHDDADITSLEAFRVHANKENEKSGVKVTMLAFLIKAAVGALQRYPEFNASLAGDELIYKRYFHIGFAADTPNGLVVPVIRDADRKGVLEIAAEMAALSAKARDGKLGPADMQGGTFSISSLGGIGGTYFTPIINAPEVAILGVSRAQAKPVWNGAVFEPRLMLPLSLSYDHRVIDGAAAARFTTYVGSLLSDLRRAVL